MAKIVLATCQFHIEKKPEKNLRAITRQMMDAKAKGAHLVHFSEACLMLVSFHNAGMTLKQYDHYTMSVPATLQAAAGSNYFAVSTNNGTRRYAWGSFVLNAEGVIVSRARPHRPAVLINTIDTKEKLYDASADWRNRCMRGVYHSGTPVKDKRSRDRKRL